MSILPTTALRAALRAGALAALLVGIAAGPAAAKALKMATLAPARSSWGKVFTHMAAELAEKSGGALTLDIFDSGVQGDEKEVVEKMKTGQLQMAAITSVGLGKIDPDVLVFQLPGLFSDAKALDKARDALAPRIEKELSDAGFVILGWGDVGPYYVFSNLPVVTPEDLKKTKFWVWTDDPMTQAVARIIGATGVPLGVPSVTAALANGKVDAYLTSPLAAAALRWYNRSSHIAPVPVAIGIGAIVVTKPSWEALSDAERTTLREVVKKWATILTKKVRQDNDKTLQLMAEASYDGVKVSADSRLTVGARKAGAEKPVVTPVPAAAEAAWKKVFVAVQDELAGKVYSKEILAEVRKHAK